MSKLIERRNAMDEHLVLGPLCLVIAMIERKKEEDFIVIIELNYVS